MKGSGTARPQSTVAPQTGAVAPADAQEVDPAATREAGLGLLGMRERAALVGGRVAVESSGESGTTLVVEVPVR